MWGAEGAASTAMAATDLRQPRPRLITISAPTSLNHGNDQKGDDNLNFNFGDSNRNDNRNHNGNDPTATATTSATVTTRRERSSARHRH